MHWSARGLVHALALPLIVLSVSRYRGGAMRVVMSRQVMFRSMALIASGVYLMFMAAAGYYVRYVGGEWGRALQAALLVAGALLLLLILFSGSARAKVRVLISKHFFKYRYDYREEWLRLTETLGASSEPRVVAERALAGLACTRHVTADLQVVPHAHRGEQPAALRHDRDALGAEAMGRQAAALYHQRFSLDHTLSRLRNPQSLDVL